jgi:cell division septation protein DedD
MARRRAGGGPGPLQWLALGGAVLVMLGLTFALGLLVGRQWARQSVSALIAAAAVEPAKKPAAPARRGGLAAEALTDRAPEPTEKLTFYQTLTEPLEAPAPPTREAKPVSVKIPPATSPPAPPATAKAATPPATPPPSLPPVSAKPARGRPADGASAGAGSGSSSAGHHSSWTVQVGAYKNRGQADEWRRELVAAGLDAYVVTLAAQEGVARYRVRIGTFRTREEAVTVAERLRAQRSLTTFVAPK